MKAPETAFGGAVREALKHYDDPVWLGANSPLATPYFLGGRLRGDARPETAAGRGAALQEALADAAASIWPGPLPQARRALWDAVVEERAALGNGGPRYLFLALDLRYLRRFYPPRTPPTAVSAIYDLLAVSESTFFRHLTQATSALTGALLRLVRPGLRLERPLLAAPLVGRDELLTACLLDLRQGRSVALSGVGGIGKSSLGTAVLDAWVPKYGFWYTIRPGLNDDLNSLLFALGHFLHGHGRSGLWLQLLADEGQIGSVEQALGLLRDDLAGSGGDARFLLIVDELDLLQTASGRPRHGAHKQLLELLEGLIPFTPLLLIGQRALIDTAAHHALRPLEKADVAQLFERYLGKSSEFDMTAVLKATGGNPRLVELYLALLQAEGSTGPLTLRGKPALQPLFSRLWKRLSREEKESLAALAVFRAAAPPDLDDSLPGLVDLRDRGLVKIDRSGGIALLPAFRLLVYDELPVAERQARHQQAAAARAGFGQYTAAAHHLVRAGEVESAVDLWFAVQDDEIAQGSAGAAQALFSAVPPERLDGRAARRLRVIQNRLHLLAGELESVLAGMERYSWHAEEALSATAHEQWGDALHMLGDFDGAREQYGQAVEILGRLSNRVVDLQVKRAGTYGIVADQAGARREALRMQHEVARYLGILGMNVGQRREAVDHFQEALRLAEEAEDEGRVAEAHYRLAYAHGDLGEMAAAEAHAAAAAAYYERVGDSMKLEGLRAELAGTYYNVGQYEKVIEPSLQALSFFEEIGHAHWPLVLSNNLAEAYFELGKIEQAETYARRVVEGENPRMLPYGYYTLGRVAAAQGDVEQAAAVFARGMQWAQRNEDQFMVAYFHQVYGTLLQGQGRDDEGRAELEKARDRFAELGIAHEVAQTEALLAG